MAAAANCCGGLREIDKECLNLVAPRLAGFPSVKNHAQYLYRTWASDLKKSMDGLFRQHVSLPRMSRRPVFTVLKDIQEFIPVDGHWLRLEELLDELWSGGVATGALPILFSVFERFPEDDGAGVLWSLVHGIECLDVDYEQALRQSLRRRSSVMGEIMLQRLEKARES